MGPDKEIISPQTPLSEEYQIPDITSELLTVMFLDVVNYTHKMSQMSREELKKFHDTFDSLTIPNIKRFSGKIIKKIGDAFLITFTSPTNAVLCAVELQKKFNYHNSKADVISTLYSLQIRVALDNGEVLIRDNDVYGDTVNIASRVESLTPPGQIYFTESVYQAMNKNEVAILGLGNHQLRGISAPIRIFKVKTRDDDLRAYKELLIDVIFGLVLIVLTLYLVKFIYFKTNLASLIQAKIALLW